MICNRLGGIVFGVLFCSLPCFMQRIIDPNEFVLLQDRLFASFNSEILVVSTTMVIAVSIVGWRFMNTYGVLSLGRETSVSLGINHDRLVTIVLILVPMNAGTVTVDGLDVTSTPSDVLARRLSILRQDSRIASQLTVRDLVEFGRYPYSKGRLTADDREHAAKAIGFLGLELLADRFLDELSGGQRQCAYVAMRDGAIVRHGNPRRDHDERRCPRGLRHGCRGPGRPGAENLDLLYLAEQAPMWEKAIAAG